MNLKFVCRRLSLKPIPKILLLIRNTLNILSLIPFILGIGVIDDSWLYIQIKQTLQIHLTKYLGNKKYKTTLGTIIKQSKFVSSKSQIYSKKSNRITYTPSLKRQFAKVKINCNNFLQKNVGTSYCILLSLPVCLGSPNLGCSPNQWVNEKSSPLR